MAVTPSTPLDLVDRVYAQLPERVAVARTRLRRGVSLAEKILFNHLADAQAQPLERGRSYSELYPDRVAMQDATAQMALLQFMTAGLPHVAVPSTVHCDHLIQARVGAAEDQRDVVVCGTENPAFIEQPLDRSAAQSRKLKLRYRPVKPQVNRNDGRWAQRVGGGEKRLRAEHLGGEEGGQLVPGDR